MTNQAPQDGQTIIFTALAAGTYLSFNRIYVVDKPKGARDFRFVNAASGSSCYAKPWQVAQSEWHAA
jgi:hypothetical protein